MMCSYDERLKNCIKAVFDLNAEDVGSLTMDTQLLTIGLNSISFIKAVVAIENEFGFEFKDEYLDFSKFKTYGDIIKLIEKELGDRE